MFTRPFHPDQFLRKVVGTGPFLDYCQSRHIPFERHLADEENLRRWTSALAALPGDEHALIELELAKVNEMADTDALAHLLQAAEGTALPPASIPDGAPLALWFLSNQPGLFNEVFLHHEIEEVECWRTALAPPGIALRDLAPKAADLTDRLADFFRLHEGDSRFCAVEAHRLAESVCFVAQVADRLRSLDSFTEAGKRAVTRLRPALPVLFVYFSADGRVLLKSHLRTADRVSALAACFAEAVLGVPVECGAHAFDLDRLKYPFRPLPDAPDMESVRLKALSLRYPPRLGGRLLRLETRAGDEPSAIEQMLRSHVPAGVAETLRVVYAELHIRMRTEGGVRHYPIRLWPDRCNLGQTPLGDRFRSCLKRWGLSHAA